MEWLYILTYSLLRNGKSNHWWDKYHSWHDTERWNLDGLLKDMKCFKEFRDSVESGLHSMDEAIIANSNVQKASLLSDNGIEASSGFVVDLLKERLVF